MVRRRRDADGAGGGGSGSWAARRVSKDHLVLAVRKDFNAAMIHEPEVITSFVYAVHNQGEQAIWSLILCSQGFSLMDV